MKFDAQNYAAIRSACEAKEEIIFSADNKVTAFENSEAPQDWTAYPPAILPPKGYAQVMIQAGNDLRGALIRLELVVPLDGGRVYYKKSGEESVDLKITWPDV